VSVLSHRCFRCDAPLDITDDDPYATICWECFETGYDTQEYSDDE